MTVMEHDSWDTSHTGAEESAIFAHYIQLPDLKKHVSDTIWDAKCSTFCRAADVTTTEIVILH